ncbi:EAL domain-containing protein [Thermodesulfitimonas autotrophica]|uniref:EAL domain-containing protein n=1 Tax=Thermodesulfitimonas autotrophica TaxID=1894989 RepID=UPI002FE1A66F
MAAYGIDPRRVVIEVTEESCRQTLAAEKTLVVFREAGCHIAIDDAGTAYSNLDRISLLAPEIIKLDCRPFHSSPYGREVVVSLGRLAERLGALLLVECVEDEEWLKFGLKAGATYAQGFLFAPAQPTLLPPEKFVPVVKDVARRLYYEEKDALTSELVLWRRLVALLEEVMTEPPFAIDRLLLLLPPVVFRLYLCTPSGEQVSPNFTRNKDGFWREEPGFIGHNWAWRPYFRELYKQFLSGSPWAVSEPYRDRHTREAVRTFIYRLPEGLFLLVDLMYGSGKTGLQGTDD